MTLALVLLVNPHGSTPAPSLSAADSFGWWLGCAHILLWFFGCWIAWRRKRLLVWLGYTWLVFALLLAAVPAHVAGANALLWLWYAGFVFLPVYWWIRSRQVGDRRTL